MITFNKFQHVFVDRFVVITIIAMPGMFRIRTIVVYIQFPRTAKELETGIVYRVYSSSFVFSDSISITTWSGNRCCWLGVTSEFNEVTEEDADGQGVE